MCACMMFKECANDTRDIKMKAKQMLVVLFFIGIDNDFFVTLHKHLQHCNL